MARRRLSEWIENSMAIKFVDLLLVGNVQGLGLLDVELIKDFSRLKLDSPLRKEQLKKIKHICLSELWIMGAYEIIRLTKDIMSKNNFFSEETKSKLKVVLSEFSEIRIPLVKFQERGNSKLYSGITTPKFDPTKGLGWSIIISNKKGVNVKIIFRKDLADNFLQLLKMLQTDLCLNSNPARK